VTGTIWARILAAASAEPGGRQLARPLASLGLTLSPRRAGKTAALMIVIALAALLSLSTALAIDDTTPPNAPTVTDDAANRPNAFRSGNTLYFNNSLAGSLILSASATDPEPSSGISHYNFSNPTPATNWTSGTLWSVALATTCSEDSGRTWGDVAEDLLRVVG